MLLAPGQARQTSPTRLGSVAGGSAAPPVVLVCLLEHVLALKLGIQPRADEEGAAHLAMQRVRLLGRRGEAVFEHHRDQVVDPLGGGLGTEVEGVRGREGLAEDHHRVHVSVHHCLETSHSFYNQIQGEAETFLAALRVKQHKEIITLDSYPERNFISMDFSRTPSLLPSAADRIIYKTRYKFHLFQFRIQDFVCSDQLGGFNKLGCDMKLVSEPGVFLFLK